MCSNLPLVSVIIPCYNHAAYVGDAIKSVINQDYGNIELIVIDDGSSDKSIEKVKELEHECTKRFARFEFRSRKNKGLCLTLNEALSWVQGDFISCIASDDIMNTTKCSSQVKYFFDNPRCDILFGSMILIDGNGFTVGEFKCDSEEVEFKDLFLGRRSLPTPTQMVRSEVFKRVGSYPSGIYIEDWYIWLRSLSFGFKVCCINDVLVFYRKHDHNMSKNKREMIGAKLKIIEDYRDHPMFNRAKANVLLEASIYFLETGRLKALKCFFDSIKCNFSSVFSKRAAYFLYKLFIISYRR